MRRAVTAVAYVIAAGCSAGCGARPMPPVTNVTEAGISIALYRDGTTSYGVVDDRRFVEISGSSILLGNIDPGASLASLVIETASPALQIGPCTRERLPDERDLPNNDPRLSDATRAERNMAPKRRKLREIEQRKYGEARTREPVLGTDRFAPSVQCTVTGPPGRHLVRILYVSSTLTYRVQHDIAVTDPAFARIDSRFAITTPPWRERAEVMLFDGAPGGVQPPREIARGPVTLDGGVSVLVQPTREVPAVVRRIYEGETFAEGNTGGEDAAQVWATLELPDVTLAPGPIRVALELDGETRWIDTLVPRDRFADPAVAEADRDRGPLRLRLWIDSSLRAQRQRLIIENDGVRMVELVALTVINVGEVPREIWLEEHARPAKKRRIERPWPRPPSAKGDTIRNKVTVKPGQPARVGYTLVYER